MDISKACSIFGVNNLNLITADSIKKRYRELAVMYHPDTGCSPDMMILVNEAKDELSSFVEKRTLSKEIITLKEYINLCQSGNDVGNKLVDFELKVKLKNCLDYVEENSVNLTFRSVKDLRKYEFKVNIESGLFVNGVGHDLSLAVDDKKMETNVELKNFIVEMKVDIVKLKFIFSICNEH